jgi:hypothetical protein
MDLVCMILAKILALWLAYVDLNFFFAVRVAAETHTECIHNQLI